MSTPFEHDEQHDDHRDDHAPRISEEDQGIDALLRAGGEQWRAEIPAVHFDQPSTRVAMLSRGHRAVLTIGIAAAVVAIVLAGSALIGRPAAPVGPQAPVTRNLSVGAQTSGTGSGQAAITVTFLPPSSPAGDVTRFTEEQRSGHLVSAEVDPSRASKILGATPFPPVDSEVWTGWDVGTGQLLVGVEDGNCASTFNGLRLADLHRLTLEVVRTNTDVGCERGWSVASFTPPSGFDPWIPGTLVTPLGTADVLPISGVVQNPADDKSQDAESIEAAEVDGGSGGAITVRWIPGPPSMLVISAPARCASSIARLGSDDRGANLRILGAPDSCAERSSAASPVTISVQTPPRSEKAFTVTVAGRTFAVPAVLLARGSSGSDAVRWVAVPARIGQALSVSRVGRTSTAVIIERPCPGNRTARFEGIQAHQTADQTIVVRQGGQSASCTAGAADPAEIGSTWVLQPNTDPAEPLTVEFGDTAIQLPAVR